MAILKKEYEISVWDETLAKNGQKKEKKRAIIGAHDMEYQGRATSIKFVKKLNGTTSLTFKMPSRFFDNEIGDYVHNDLCDNIFNERKVKLKYKGEWYEYYVKNVSEEKHYKSIVYEYSCQDAFIDELSRNGYGITFDTELYNNVEELGSFTNKILEDSIWYYDSKNNWGDFTEYNEEKLFKIPLSQFSNLSAYKIDYNVEGQIKNLFSGEVRQQEMGDDKSREDECFWDGTDGKYSLLNKECTNITGGHLYIPYSQLGFCYENEQGEYEATEVAKTLTINGITSYALAPTSIDPTSLIQFIYIPENMEVNIDESGLLVNKDCSYVMTLKQWNKSVKNKYGYETEKKKIVEDNYSAATNKIVVYDGYLEDIGGTEVVLGKKISISDRTEANISEDIDQYVVVYNNKAEEFKEYYSNDLWQGGTDNYRVCSFEDSRTIIPQLARNLVQNGINISDISGWKTMVEPVSIGSQPSKITVDVNEAGDDCGGLQLSPCAAEKVNGTTKLETCKDLNNYTFINFGITGQQEMIETNQVYVLGAEIDKKSTITSMEVIIGDGKINTNGDYSFNDEKKCIIKTFTTNDNGKYFFIKPNINYSNPFIGIRLAADKNRSLVLKKLIFCKAYTKGIDFFEDGFYKYSGRDIFYDNKTNNKWINISNCAMRAAQDNEFISETDIMEGALYGYKRYFIQQINTKDGKISKDTFKLKSYLNNENENNGLNPTQYSEEDYEIITNFIDLNRCKHYNSDAPKEEKDCKHPDSNGVCQYQKYGYCPYLFQSEKHCRKIRTLNGEKSNRFNLTQELGKVFEIYPIYHINHYENGRVKTIIDENGIERLDKKVFYITEKGVENKLGFRYEKNLSNISRTLSSDAIVTKLYVNDVDSSLSKTGMCSIKTAEDNPSKDSFIIDFSYYTMRGLMDKENTDFDLYGKNDNDFGYIKKLGYFNESYDAISNKIIAIQDQSYTQLEANILVNTTGIETALSELNKIKKKMSLYTKENKNGKSDIYTSYEQQFKEQQNILFGLIADTFFTNNEGYYYTKKDDNWIKTLFKNATAKGFIDSINSGSNFSDFKKEILDKFKYTKYGLIGQYVAEYEQIKKWKKEKAAILKQINELSLQFYKKYEPYLKEGTWSDSNYLSDNAYYFGAKEVAKEGAIPKVNYNISVTDLSNLGDDDYLVDVADTTFVEDVETFGINRKTGLPNRLKVIISSITRSLDTPTEDSIEIQNYTTQFEDLFQQVAASVQSLSLNENIYKRASNFTSTKNVSKDSLQGALNENQLTLVETDSKNIQIDYNGQSGSDINNHNNKYKMNGQGMYFSDNGGQSWDVGVTPKGINADYIKVGSLDASKISIVDGNYLYFLWDKSGITAYKNPQVISNSSNYFQDFAKFNKYGLSLVENGKIRLRAGYEFQNLSVDGNGGGDYSDEEEITEETKIGFYLYDNKGNAILKTETIGEDKKDQSARLSLAGEIYATDSLSNVITESTYEYSGNINNQYLDKVSVMIMEDFKEGSFEDKCYKNETFKEWLNSDTLIKSINFVLDGQTYEAILNSSQDVYSIDKDTSNLYYTKLKVVYIGMAGGSGTYNIYNFIEYRIITTENSIVEEETISNLWKISKDNTLISMKGDRNTEKTFLTKKRLTKGDYIYYNKPTQYNQAMVPQLNKSIYAVGTDEIALYKIETEKSGEIVSNGKVGVFINNQILSRENDKNDGFNRLICCANYDNENNKINNILSVLNSGELYLGGEIENKGINSLENLPDKIKIKETNSTFALKKMDSGYSISIGGQDLIEGIEANLGEQLEQVRGMVQSAGLIKHSHDIGGSRVNFKNSEANVANNKLYSSLTSTTPIQNTGQTIINRVAVYGKNNNIYYMNINDFAEQLGLQIKQSEKTDESGDVTSAGGTGLAGYYVGDM